MSSSRHLTWNDFGPFLRAICTRLHLTQDELAERLGIGRRHLCRLEAGTRHPSRPLLRLLAGLPSVSDEERERILAFDEMRECHAEEGDNGRGRQ